MMMKIGSVYHIDGKYLELIRVEMEMLNYNEPMDSTYIFRELNYPVHTFVEEAIEVNTEEWTKIISST